MDKPKTIRSARWGAACAPCAAAKARCIRTQSSGSQQCDRCRGLERECAPQIPIPRKKRKTKSSASANTRMAPPEQGLNNLDHSPSTAGGESSTVHDSISNESPDYLVNNYSISLASTEPQAQVTFSQQETTINTPAHGSTSGAPAGPKCTCMTTLGMEDLVPLESDEILLSIYRNQLSSAFPFVIISAGTTPSQLHATRPFLMKVIRMIASVRNLRSVRGQSRAVMEHLSNAMLIRSERSLDLLQGILVSLGAYHYHCMAHAHFNNLIRLAVSLVEDLDLGICPKSRHRKSQMPLIRADEPSTRTNEEKRALLGVWYMSSNAGLVVKQLASTKYTKYMDQCLEELEKATEFRTDQLLIQMIHIQRVTEKIFHFHSDDSRVDQQVGSAKPTVMARLEKFRVELDTLRDALPTNVKSDYFMSCYHLGAYLRLFAPLLEGSHLPDTESQSFASLSLSGVPVSDVFSHFTAALKAWFENWLAIPVCSYFYMPQPVYVQCVHGAMMLSRWVRIVGPNAVKLSNLGSVKSQNNSTALLQSTPALSGVPQCPDLGLPRPPSSPWVQVVSAEILNTIRAQVAAQPNLQIDALGILDTMGARFEAAKKEMTAAQGLEWENDIWFYAGRHSRLKKDRIVKWCEVVTLAAERARVTVTDVQGSVNDESREDVTMLPGRSDDDDFGWVTSGFDWDSMQWESVMFEELLQDVYN